MQRFGRSAQKTKDRWGGGFILAAVLAIAAAWWAGGLLDHGWPGGPQSPTSQDPMGQEEPSGVVGAGTATARDFTAYFVQVGAFKTEAGAQTEVERLAAKGIKAAVVKPSAESAHYRLFTGPFSTAQARDEVKESLKSAKIEGLSRSWNISDGPAIPASTAGKNEKWQQGVAVLNTYMQEASLWFEHHIAGSALPIDTLTARGNELKAVVTALEAQATDPAVAELVRLAHEAELNASEIAAMADIGATSFEEQRAMQNLIALLDSYRSWAPSSTGAAN